MGIQHKEHGGDSTYTDIQWTYWGEWSIISFDLQFLRVNLLHQFMS